jgi:hypothetical protein
MPALVWVAFWSWMMGTTACWIEAPVPVKVKSQDRRRHPAV